MFSVYVSNKCLGEANAAGLGTTLRKGVVYYKTKEVGSQDHGMTARACNLSTVGAKVEGP